MAEAEDSSREDAIPFSLGVDRLSKTERGLVRLYAWDETPPAPVSAVCLLDAPSYMIPGDLVKFLASMLPRIRRIQILRRFGSLDSYLALLHLYDKGAAEAIVAGYDGVPFSSLERSLCSMRRVKAVELPAGSGQVEGTGQTEDPVFCPVCLDSLSLDALFTGCCGHTLHAACATRLESSLCPVCRFQHDDPDTVFSACGTCGWRGDDRDVWVCLVCGAVGCGSQHADHIRQHYIETLHAYAVSTATGAVFDFAGDGFVHRLALQRSDTQSESSPSAVISKLAEVVDPRLDEERSQQPLKMCRSALPRGGSEFEERIVSALLERAACSFSSEMARRLERHRLQLETRLQRHKTFIAHEAQSSGSASWASKVRQQLTTDRSKLETQISNLKSRILETEQEVDTLSQLRESLMKNNTYWREELTAAQKRLMSAELHSRTALPPLENKVREIMRKLDGIRECEGTESKST